MTTYIFSPPVVEEGPSGTGSPLFRFFRLNRGISISKYDGVYSQQRWPNQDDIDTYSEFYHGAHKHSVSAETKAALIAGNIGVTDTNFTVE